MKIIYSDNSIKDFLNVPQFNKLEKYKISRFLTWYFYNKKLLLFNILTKTLITISIELWELLRDGKFNKIEEDDLKTLISEHFVVPEELDELTLYTELYTLIKQIAGTNKFIDRYNILTTTACNARCFYCFEQGLHPIHMTNEIAKDVSAFILSSHNPHKRIHLRWFGGEPLVNKKAISIITQELTNYDIDFYSTMSTNGLLFSNDLIKEAKDNWHIKLVRISLDGFPEEHNRRKNYYAEGNHFERTINNIEKLIEHGISVNIRLTIDHGNVDSMIDLSKWLIGKLGKNPLITIYTRCIFEEVSEIKASQDYDKVLSLVRKTREIDSWLIDQDIYDWSRISPIGFSNYFCAANNPHAVVVSPDGKLCCCESVNNETAYWGDIWKGETNTDLRASWLNGQIREKCKSCKFLPVCTPFDKCEINYYDCVDKNEYIHNLFMKLKYDSYCHC
jgi:radical SAM protein with 4Fe4S-binding SPASM domain